MVEETSYEKTLRHKIKNAEIVLRNTSLGNQKSEFLLFLILDLLVEVAKQVYRNQRMEDDLK